MIGDHQDELSVRGAGPDARRRGVFRVVFASVALAGVYLGAIVFFAQVKDLSSWRDPLMQQTAMAWRAPSLSALPDTDMGMTRNGAAGRALAESIRYGALLFNETPLYLPNNSRARVSCASCHAEGGMQPFAAPMVGLAGMYPMYNKRAGRMISLKDRIEECMVRSQNGDPIDPNGRTMQALVDYIDWVSQAEPGSRPFEGRGLVSLPELKPDPVHGGAIYAAQCAGCHGEYGQGRPPRFPPVWGPASFNDGAGMNDVQKMAAFVQHNMPQNRMGTLTAQEAYDVAAYIHLQPRPAFNPAYKIY